MITDKIGIGDASDGKQVPSIFDAVLNVAVDLDVPSTQGKVYRHKVGLLDGPGNDDLLLLSAVMVLHSLNKRHNRILIHCVDGKSRSVMVVSAYVAILMSKDFESVLTQVMAAREVDQYVPTVYAQYEKLMPLLRKLIT